jgi:hypothetical protein
MLVPARYHNTEDHNMGHYLYVYIPNYKQHACRSCVSIAWGFKHGKFMYVIVGRYLKLHETAGVYITCAVNDYTDSLHDARYKDWNYMQYERSPPQATQPSAWSIFKIRGRHFAPTVRTLRTYNTFMGPLNIFYVDPDFGILPRLDMYSVIRRFGSSSCLHLKGRSK